MNAPQNLRYALRQLRKSPGFTAAAVLTLALGIGATTAIYTVLYATFLAPMPYPHPEQLVMVRLKNSEGRDQVSTGDFLDWKRESTVFQDLNAWSGGSFNLSISERPEQVPGHVTTPGWFKMQGFHFLLGRDFLPEEGELGKAHVVVLEHRLWQACCWRRQSWRATSPPAARPRSILWWRCVTSEEEPWLD